MKQYNYNVIISSFDLISTNLKEALFFCGEETEGSRIIDNKHGDWGDIYPFVMYKNSTSPLPNKLKLRWITDTDQKCYELEAMLDTTKMEKLWEEQEARCPNVPFKYVVVGIAPYGEVAVWLRSNDNAVLCQQLTANEGKFDEMESQVYASLKADEALMASLLSKEQYQSFMSQFQYRYVALEEFYDGKEWKRYPSDDKYYEIIDIDFVEDKRTDGTFDFVDDEVLQKYHTAGMPKRIAVKWKENDDKYFAHFWLDSYYVNWFFESLREKNHETPADLMIRMDTRANRYEVAMATNGMAPRAFVGTQFIVFKNNEEIARSEHFYKEVGEWRWE